MNTVRVKLMSNQIVAIIPARLGSSRFKNKVLQNYHEKPLLFHVWNSLKKSKKINRVIVATDSSLILKIAMDFGAEVFKTSSKHRTGSDRVAEVARKIKGEIFLNIQADNLGISPVSLDKILLKFIKDRKYNFATLVKRIELDDNLFNPSRVKVVSDKMNNALWFSRFPLPYLQNSTSKKRAGQFSFLNHIGIYLFRRKGLLQFGKWSQSPLEKAESLEQLRILENGERIKLYITKMKVASIDTIDDLKTYRG